MNATHDIREESRKDPDVLKREIDATRADVGETLDALQARLSPGQLLDQAMGMVQRHGGDLARNLGYSVRENPVAMLLTSVGLAWLIASGQSARRGDGRVDYEELGGEDERLGAELGTPEEEPLGFAGNGDGQSFSSRVGERTASMREHARERLHATRERLSGASSSASESAHRAREAARYRARRAREGFSRMLEEQPLVLGLVGVAVGAIIAAALPPTRREDELLGEARDRALDRAKSAGAEQMERVRESARAHREDGGEHAERSERAPPEAGEEVLHAAYGPGIPPDRPPPPPEPFISRPP